MRLRAYSLVTWTVMLTSRTRLRLAAAQSNITCKGTAVAWYASNVGETPCMTYQRLRQICNSAYMVGTLRFSTPGDNCNEQVADCCCNSVAFALSMLCLNCQQGSGSDAPGDNGIDAGTGAYQQYLTRDDGHQCAPNNNQSIGDIQTAVCDSNIKIHDNLYDLFWDTGSWFYKSCIAMTASLFDMSSEYTKQSIEKDSLRLAKNTFTRCASTNVNATSFTYVVGTITPSMAAVTSIISAQLPASTNTPSGPYTSPAAHSLIGPGALGGIVIGSFVLLLAIGVFLRFLQRRRQISLEAPLVLEMDPAQCDPFIVTTVRRPQASPNLASSASKLSSSAGATSTNPPSMARSSGPLLSEFSRGSDTSLDIGPDSDLRGASTASFAMGNRHEDAGPVQRRSLSGRLPPAYSPQR